MVSIIIGPNQTRGRRKYNIKLVTTSDPNTLHHLQVIADAGAKLKQKIICVTCKCTLTKGIV